MSAGQSLKRAGLEALSWENRHRYESYCILRVLSKNTFKSTLCSGIVVSLSLVLSVSANYYDYCTFSATIQGVEMCGNEGIILLKLIEDLDLLQANFNCIWKIMVIGIVFLALSSCRNRLSGVHWIKTICLWSLNNTENIKKRLLNSANLCGLGDFFNVCYLH